MNYFLEIYGALPRAGPGSNESTRRALAMLPDLPESPRILDLGCGPGMQTLELLKALSGKVVALDFLPEMIARVNASAEAAGLSSRLETVVQDMREMTFAEASFDVIWSEGAIYNLGFERGLEMLKRFIAPGGYLVVSEVVWLQPNPPAAAVEFWSDYPEIATVAEKLALIERSGYQSLGHFVLPASAWTDEYYDPMEALIAEKMPAWQGIPEAEAVLDEAANEISMFRRHAEYFSYAFFVMRR